MVAKEIIHKVKLVDGVFTASETSDVINALIDEKINFHKIHRLSLNEGNMYSDTSYDDSRVNELIRDKQEFKSFCHEARLEGKKVRIQGTLHLEILD